MPLLHHFNLHFFDIDSTRRFLKHLQDIKRIRKGKVQILLLANRVKPNSASSKDIQQFLKKSNMNRLHGLQSVVLMAV